MAHELDPVTMGLLSAGAGFLDPRGGLLGGFQSGLQGFQGAVEHNRSNMLQAQMAQKMQDEQDVRNAFSQFGRPDESGNVDHGAIFKQMMGSGNPALVQFALLNAPKMQPKAKFTEKVLVDGQPRTRVIFDNGTRGEVGDLPVAEKLMQSNLGGVNAFVNPFTAQPVAQLQRTMDPGQAASLAQSAQQFNARMAQDRSQFDQNFNLQAAKHMFDRQQADRPQFKDGFFVTPPNAQNPQGQIVETPLSAAPKGSQMEKDKSRLKIQEILSDDTPDLIKKATGSGMGQARDIGGMIVGVATDGAKALTTLRLRSNTLAGNVPRFEGPQSDADRQYYMEMVGDLGNPRKTAGEKMEAYKELLRVNKLADSDGVIRSSIRTESSGKKSAISSGGFSSKLISE